MVLGFPKLRVFFNSLIRGYHNQNSATVSQPLLVGFFFFCHFLHNPHFKVTDGVVLKIKIAFIPGSIPGTPRENLESPLGLSDLD